MKKIKSFLSNHWYLFLVLAMIGLNVVMSIYMGKLRAANLEKVANDSYLKGFADGAKSVELGDLCFEPEKKGMGTDFERGFGYEIVQCKVNLHDWREDWEFEGDWDRCDENAENCEPFVEDGIYLEGNSITI